MLLPAHAVLPEDYNEDVQSPSLMPPVVKLSKVRDASAVSAAAHAHEVIDAYVTESARS